MAGEAEVTSLHFISPPEELQDPLNGNLDVQVHLKDGTRSSFVVMTPRNLTWAMDNEGLDYYVGSPVLFVRRLDRPTVLAAVRSMAARDGKWLRAYDSLGDLVGTVRAIRKEAARAGLSSAAEPARPRPGTPEPPSRAPRYEWAARQEAKGHGELRLTSGGESPARIVACTPEALERIMHRERLDFDYGNPVLFVRGLEDKVVTTALEELARHGGEALRRYDAGRGFFRLVRELKEAYA